MGNEEIRDLLEQPRLCQLRWKRTNYMKLIPDAKAEAMRCIRIVDEGGEDYAYPEKMFMAMEVYESVSRALH